MRFLQKSLELAARKKHLFRAHFRIIKLYFLSILAKASLLLISAIQRLNYSHTRSPIVRYIEIRWTISNWENCEHGKRCENTWPNIISDKTKSIFGPPRLTMDWTFFPAHSGSVKVFSSKWTVHRLRNVCGSVQSAKGKRKKDNWVEPFSSMWNWILFFSFTVDYDMNPM